jgi:predicted nucleic acid-binding protein
MSRVFWDTMMFIYLLDEHPTFEPQVRSKLERSYSRGDSLVTSYLALGELMAGSKQSAVKRDSIRTAISNLGFSFLPFDGACPAVFAKLRFESKLKAPDAIHLACAASASVDMYLTGDAQLLNRRLHVPGIQFIADFTLPIL